MPIVNLSNLAQFTAVNLTADGGYDRQDRHIPNCCEITLVWNIAASKLARNVLHGSYTGGFPGTVAQANSILAGLNSGAQWTALALQFATSTALAQVTLRDLNTENTPVIASTGAAAAGTGGAIAVPDEVAVAITHRTAKAGRAFRGRSFIPGWSTAAVGGDNALVPAGVTALGNWANTIKPLLTGLGYTFCIGQHSRVAYTSPNGTPHDARPAGTVEITSSVVRDNHFDSQRRRGLK